jgi:hypothetical protein
MIRRLAHLAAAPVRVLAGDRRGASAAEFALTLPIWAMLIFSFFTMSRVYFGRAGVLNGMGEAARIATLWPRRPDSEMVTAFNQRTFGLLPGETPTLVMTPGTSNGQDYIDFQVSYTPQIDLFLITVSPITLNYERRAFRPG